MKLNVSEIFYSLQGEGIRAGTPNVFIRLQGCKAKDACYASGVICDTEFESGKEYSVKELHEKIKGFPAQNIVWTGGEPAQQLTEEIVQFFKDKEYYQAIETSGLFSVPQNMDFICISPKVAEHVLKKNFGARIVNELRYVRHEGQEIPNPELSAKHYFISPHSDGWEINMTNVKHCIKLVKENPLWKLSVQQHKIWHIV